MTVKPLSVKHERFCQLIASLILPAKAYQQAGYQVSDAVAASNASRLLKNAEIQRRVQELQEKASAKLEFKRQDLVEWLVEAITTPPSKLTADSRIAEEVIEDQVGGGNRGKLKRGHAPSGNETVGPDILRRRVKGVGKHAAARLLTEIMGWKEPEQLIVETGPKTLEAIRQRANDVVSALDARAAALAVSRRN